MFKFIRRIEELTSTLRQLDITYRIVSSGREKKYYTVIYSNKNRMRFADFSRNGKLIIIT